MSSPADRWPRTRDIFHAALDRPPEDRAAFAAAAAGSDTALRDEVMRLLEAHAGAGSFMESPVIGLTGRRIGRYDVGARLGTGGMGEVYLAHDRELRRNVALKVAIGGGDDERLKREAQHAASLSHPNICTIHEVGSHQGRCFIAMEYIEGRRLSDLVPAGGLPAEEVRRIGMQVAEALGFAHARQVVHGDLKAANIVITTGGLAKVLDFGLARRIDGSVARDRALASSTAAGPAEIAGTLACLAPEVLRGRAADARSDVWSLGILLHELAAGVRPFSGATPFELTAAILHEPPSALPPAIPLHLRDVVQRCLAKDPADRYPHGGAVRAALAAGERDVKALPSWPQRRRVQAAVLLVVLAAGGSAAWRAWRRVPAAPAERVGRVLVIAVMPFQHLGASAEASWLAGGLQSMVLTGLAQTPGLSLVSTQRLYEVVRGTGGPPLDALDRAEVLEVARRAGAGATVVGSIVQSGATIRVDAQVEDLSTGRVLAATSVSGADLFALADQLTSRIRAGVGVVGGADVRPVTDVSSSSLDAYRRYSQGLDAFDNLRLDAARALLAEATAIDPSFADAYLQLALLSGPSGHPAERSGYLRRAAQHRDRLSEPRRLLMEVEVARDEGRYRDAAQGLQDLRSRFPGLDGVSTLAVQLHSPVVGPVPDEQALLAITGAVVAANPASALARNNHAYGLAVTGRYDDAIREFEAYAHLAPREPNPYDSMGEAYLLKGDPQQALTSYARALAIDPAFLLGGRAWTLAVLGRFDEALADAGSPPYLSAVMLARTGRYRDAGAALDEGIRSASAGGDHVRVATLRMVGALFALERGDPDAAVAAVDAASRTFALVPDDRARYGRALLALTGGIAESRRGRLDAARAHLDAQRRLYPSAGVTADRWWEAMLDGEIAFVEGDLDRAATLWGGATPLRRMLFSRLAEGSVLSNDLVFRDGLARLAARRGDLRQAIALYRELLAYGPRSRWVAMFEPRYVLETARLLERLGAAAAARDEYTRFLQFWRAADPTRPEVAEARAAARRLGATATPAVHEPR